jgi:hypothetical protein
MSSFKYYIDNKEYTPTNTGDFTLDYQLEQEAGSYQYVKTLSGSVKYIGAVYDYVLKKGDCAKILFSIIETCNQGEFIVYEGYFTNRNCSFNPDKKQVEINMKEDSFYNCLIDNYDKNFNILEASNIVQSTWKNTLQNYEFRAAANSEQVPFYSCFLGCGGSTASPFVPVGIAVREKKTIYCQGGEPQTPAGTAPNDYKLFIDNCDTTNLAQFYRCPPIYIDIPCTSFASTNCVTPCVPAPPPVTAANEDWFLLDTIVLGLATFSYWLDRNAFENFNNVNFDNGRLLVDVINLGLNKICPELDLQSQFLFNTTNPVTLSTPSSTQGIQVHSISDIKDPTATEPATLEETTLKEILESYINAKLNCFWRVDENTRRIIIEHYNDLNNQGVFDLTTLQSGKFTKLKNKYDYDLTDIPRAEEFPSLDFAIDFTGVDINYNNDCAEGVKAYNTSKFYSEVESIYNNNQEYGNDGLVMITPDSLAPKESGLQEGERSEFGAITGDYYPNLPQGMANLHEKFWKYYRPFPQGEMNFVGQAFSKLRPDKKLEEITIPINCFFFFAPYQRFIGNSFTQGQLQSSSFNFKTGLITLQINYYE